MPTVELGTKAASFFNALIAWSRSFSFFTLVIAFTVSAHVIFAYLLAGLKSLGVDFDAFDPGHVNIPALQVLLFAIENGLVVYALVRSGQSMAKTLVGVAALMFAAAMLMLTIVSAQCDLFGACL